MDSTVQKQPAGFSTFIFLSLGLGIIFGATLHRFMPEQAGIVDHYLLSPLGKGFLRLIRFVIVPLVFSSLILSLTRTRDTGKIGRYATRLGLCYFLTTAIAVGIGVTTALVLHPGAGVEGLLIPLTHTESTQPPFMDWLISIIPANPFETLSTGNLLQTIVAAVLISLGIRSVGDRAKSLVEVLESVFLVSERILAKVLLLAPIGVFALVASVIATQGVGVLSRLLGYILGLIFAFGLMMVCYALILVVFRISPAFYFRSFFATFSLAFGTASSSATLPVAIQNAHENYGLLEDISSFAIPLGTALKRDGSAIFQSFNALFIAQVYHVPLTASLIWTIAFCTFLISYSTPGIPGSGLISMTTVLGTAGLPLEGIAIVAGIDRFTDGFKSVVNIMGTTVSAVILDRLEQPDDRSCYRQFVLSNSTPSRVES